jgi:hypothetical protein
MKYHAKHEPRIVQISPGVTESERAYIQALAKRYAADAGVDSAHRAVWGMLYPAVGSSRLTYANHRSSPEATDGSQDGTKSAPTCVQLCMTHIDHPSQIPEPYNSSLFF